MMNRITLSTSIYQFFGIIILINKLCCASTPSSGIDKDTYRLLQDMPKIVSSLSTTTTTTTTMKTTTAKVIVGVESDDRKYLFLFYITLNYLEFGKLFNSEYFNFPK